jgi:hypothetical protein
VLYWLIRSKPAACRCKTGQEAGIKG